MQYVLGVDGGNTKTHYAVFDAEGNLISFKREGTISHEQLSDGYDGIPRVLGGHLKSLLDSCGLGLKDISFAVFGLAGTDVKKQYAEIHKRISSIGMVNFKIYNDAFLGIKAGSEKGYGISSINGTGTSCVGIDRHGNWLQVGGCGYITGDLAGGSYIETAVIRTVYNSLYKGGEKTLMKEMLFEVLEITDEETLLDTVYEKLYTGKIKNDLICKIAFNAANKGDRQAMELLRQIGVETARSVIGAYKRLDFSKEETIDVIMAGSVYTKGENPIILDTFKNEVSAGIECKVNFHLLREPPVAGAVIWALEEINGETDESIRRKVREELIKEVL